MRSPWPSSANVFAWSNTLTPEQHNKFLSWAHFAHAGLTGGLMLLMMAFMIFIFNVDAKPPPPGFIAFIVLFIGLMTALTITPSILAGYALRKRKRWAKTMAIIAGVLAGTSAPVGTAVCIYTFWFLFSEPGKLLYDSPQRMLPEERQAPWNERQPAEKEAQYVRPPSPPDWR